MDINPYQPPQAEVLGTSNVSDAEMIRKAHINHEASVKSIGTLYYLGGMLCIAVGLSAVVGRDTQPAPAAAIGVATVFVLIALAQFWIGSGLRKLKPASRIPAAVLTGIGLLAFPVGTLINAYFMYLLLCKKGKMVLSNEYKQIIAETPHIKYKSIVPWVILGLLLLIFAIGIIAAIVSRNAH
jgi:hypothetical protein